MADSTLGCRDHWRQPRARMGGDRPHPGLACAAGLRNPGTQRAHSLGVGARRRSSVRVQAVFSDHERLVSRPDVDVVAVTVKAPNHRELVTATLTAGKAVYCEWPLGRDLADTQAMAAIATARSTHRGRLAGASGSSRGIRSATARGRVRPRGHLDHHGGAIAARRRARPAERLHARQGQRANMLTIAVGHCADMLNHVLGGEFAVLSALSDLRRPLITIAETGGKIAKTAPDQVAVIGTLTSGANASTHIR
jgi:predicted dehydrogenase